MTECFRNGCHAAASVLKINILRDKKRFFNDHQQGGIPIVALQITKHLLCASPSKDAAFLCACACVPFSWLRCGPIDQPHNAANNQNADARSNHTADARSIDARSNGRVHPLWDWPLWDWPAASGISALLCR